jgi:hypothetical protein
MDKVARDFCRYHLGRDCFAPFTGQDFSAWHAFVYLVEAWCRGDAPGRDAAIVAMEHTLAIAQRKSDIHQVFLQTIPAVGDWDHQHDIWPLLRSPWWRELRAVCKEEAHG